MKEWIMRRGTTHAGRDAAGGKPRMADYQHVWSAYRADGDP
jgi:hypothetical protein